MHNKIEQSLRQSAELRHVAIDASSMIYLHKLGLLRELGATLLLGTTADVWAETSFTSSDVAIQIFPAPPASSPDEQLLHLAISNKWAMLSEDKKLLLRAQKGGIPYFNTLMMILFLFFKGRVSEDSVRVNIASLKKIARYGPEIWNYGNRLFLQLQKQNRE